MAVTQKQIAQHLGLSQPIVAQALAGHPAVSERTRQRVQEAARSLGYGAHSNSAARSLIARRHGSRSKTGTIAVLTGSIFEGMPLHDVPFFKPLFRGIEQEAAEHKLDVLFSLSARDQLPRLVIEQGVDGVLSIYSKTINALLRQSRLAVPALCVGDAGPDEMCLMPDYFEGVRLAIRHLAELGHRRIAYLGYLNNDFPEMADRYRLDGYFQGLRESGLRVLDDLVDTHLEAPSRQAGASGMERILKRTSGVTALICYNDTAAMGAIRKAQELGLRVPQDLSVVGFDDTCEDYGFAPHLTTIRFERHAMGQRAVQLLVEANFGASLGNREASTGHELLPVKLVRRDSTKQLAEVET